MKTVKLIMMATVVLAVASCQKENVEKEVAAEPVSERSLYPEKLTIDNWEEFVYAPQSVIDELAKEEMEKLVTTPQTIEKLDESSKSASPLYFGYVQAYGGSWGPISGVNLSVGACTSTSLNFTGINYVVHCSGNLCMDYTTSSTNGVSTFDIVLTRRHILGIAPFTKARQFLAADVNRSGSVSTFDIIHMQKVILGIYTDFPLSDNVVFVRDVDYNNGQSIIDATGTWSAYGGIASNICYPVNVTANRYRRAIKTGDVSGNFSF